MLNNTDYKKLSQLKNYPDFNINPDFFLDQFYLNDVPFLNKEINFAGNYITVLNSFIPYNLEAFVLYYSLDISPTIQIVSNTPLNLNPKMFLILPSLSYETQYNKLYRTLAPSPIFIVQTTWQFEYKSWLSTPIIVLLSRDVHPISVESFKDDNYKISLGSTIPTVNSTATLAIGHGFSDVVKVAIQVDSAVNPLTITIRQQDELTGVFDDAVINPAVFPFHQVVILPERCSREMSIAVNGGGVGETGNVLIDVLLSKRG